MNSPGRAVFTVMQSFARGWAPMRKGSGCDSCQPQRMSIPETSTTFSESDGESSGRQVTKIASIFVLLILTDN